MTTSRAAGTGRCPDDPTRVAEVVAGAATLRPPHPRGASQTTSASTTTSPPSFSSSSPSSSRRRAIRCTSATRVSERERSIPFQRHFTGSTHENRLATSPPRQNSQRLKTRLTSETTPQSYLHFIPRVQHRLDRGLSKAVRYTTRTDPGQGHTSREVETAPHRWRRRT